ncbi:MAG: phosphoribosylaminoimidazolesuccinocarboxamide synthase [Tissierellia bacterium]|nr:phosphoribosylaminoimidazolesuccinocarboxamide synthase [Tissierellia bacterium]
MKLIYKGKTKDVYELEDGNYLFKFKDDVTGEDGVFDPGANEVVFSIEGSGRAALRLTKYFFERLNSLNIPTHYIEADLENNTMKVLPAKIFGKGVEVILRYRAVGSFIRRYGLYVEEGAPLDGYIEFTLKDDERKDPLITEDGLVMLNIMTREEVERVKRLTKEISQIVREELKKRDIELYDIKLEFGRIGDDEHIGLIDEISGGNMRAYKDGKYIEPLKLVKIFFAD